MPALVEIVTHKDLKDFVDGRLSAGNANAVAQLIEEDESVRKLVSQMCSTKPNVRTKAQRQRSINNAIDHGLFQGEPKDAV